MEHGFTEIGGWMKRLLRGPFLYALLCTGFVLLWQALTVHFNYEDDWSSLFHTGAFQTMPPTLVPEGTYRFQNEPGYDGQFYHFIAHDPFLQGDTKRFVDNPRLRWRRILVPAMAYFLAFGQSAYIDSTFAIVVLAFVFLGSYWLSIYCQRFHLHPAVGLAFALVPGVLVSIDRFTVDVALAALCVGFALYGPKERSWRLFLVLALAPLARETGTIVVAAYVLYSLLRRNRTDLLFGVAAALPYLMWLGYLARHTRPDQTVFVSYVPFRGLLERTLHPIQYALTSRWVREAAILDYLAVLGIWVAVGLTAILVWRRRRDLVAIAAVLFCAVFVAFLGEPQAWLDAYAFARTMSPLLIWLALIGIAERSWLYGLPLAMTAPRVLFQLTPQWKGIIRGVKAALIG